jgi:hypothetical protein
MLKFSPEAEGLWQNWQEKLSFPAWSRWLKGMGCSGPVSAAAWAGADEGGAGCAGTDGAGSGEEDWEGACAQDTASSTNTMALHIPLIIYTLPCCIWSAKYSEARIDKAEIVIAGF